MTSTTAVVHGTNDKPVASDSLAHVLERLDSFDGQLFIGYPIIGSADGKVPIDAVYVSPTKGVVVFDLVDGADITGFEDRQDDSATKLGSKLLQHRELVSKRSLRVPIETVTYAPALADSALGRFTDSDYMVANESNLGAVLDQCYWPAEDANLYAHTLSALQNISSVRKARTARTIKKNDSRGAKLKRLENSIATLDAIQGKAVIETVKGVQRIRGLAGSGKTIVLALKAAYLHAQHPTWRIGVTFQTRSLRDQFIRLINNFSIETGEEPDWENLRVLHAWGASGGGSREGIYHEFCVSNGVDYNDFGTAAGKFGRVDAFSGACKEALAAAPDPIQNYDVILIDEAQDLPAEFIKMCYMILNPDKRLVYAYDELQNLSGTGTPSALEIFGVDNNGVPRVQFENSIGKRDVILEKCYRNSRPVLTTAHALGFGIYRQPNKAKDQRDTGLVQVFDQPELWEEIGYALKSGPIIPGSQVVLARTPDTSPLFLEDHSLIDDLVKFEVFSSQTEQAEWVADCIEKNLDEDELRHDDIVVISPVPLTAQKNLGHVRAALLRRRISSHLAGVDGSPDVFFRRDVESITCSGIYRAKGNEAGMVYVVDADECFDPVRGLASRRNMLFTAITRSKAWVRVAGIGSEMAGLQAEYERIKDASFELRFRYPTERERSHLEIVHRDMSPDELTAVRRQREAVPRLLEDLREGRIFPEDLGEDVVAQLMEELGKRRE